MKRRTHEDVQVAITAHNPITLLEPYRGVHDKHHLECVVCRYNWVATLNNLIRGSSGCPECSNKAKRDTTWLVKQLQLLNSTRTVQVRLVSDDFTGMHSKVTVTCDNGHIWNATASNLINSKQTCRICTGKSKKSHEQFAIELNIQRPDISIAEGSIYINAHDKMSFICSNSHTWQATPIGVLLGSGCPHCVSKGYSKVAVDWLNSISSATGEHIQHAENGGEYLIPGTKWYADGYCEATNTIYEFYGSVYHGDLELFEPEAKCHPFNKKVTAKYLHEKTIAREEEIRNLGYNVISIWEREYAN